MGGDVSGDSITEVEVAGGVSEGSASEAESAAKGADSATCARPSAQVNLSGFIMFALTVSVVLIWRDGQKRCEQKSRTRLRAFIERIAGREISRREKAFRKTYGWSIP